MTGNHLASQVKVFENRVIPVEQSNDHFRHEVDLFEVRISSKNKFFALRYPMSEAGKKWVMAHSNQGIYSTPLRLHTFRFKTRMRTGRTLGTTKLGHLPSIPSRCSLGCRQCTTLQFMAITTAE